MRRTPGSCWPSRAASWTQVGRTLVGWYRLPTPVYITLEGTEGLTQGRAGRCMVRRGSVPVSARTGARIGHLEERGGLALAVLAAAVVALRRRHLGVAGQALRRRDVGAGVEQVGDEGAPQVVRG